MLHFDALSGQQELAEPVPVPVGNDVGAPGVPVPLQMITKALTNPARVFLQDRLRFSSPTDSDSVTDVIPLSLTGLARWKLADELIEARFDRRAEWTPTVKDAWVHAEQKRGAVPPLAFGGNELNELNARMDVVQQLLSAELEGGAATPESIAIDLSVPRDLAGVTRIEGVIEGIYGDVLVLVTASKLKPRDRLTAWVQLAALSAHDPSRQWRALLIGDDGNGGVASARVELSDSSMAPKVLTTAVDLFERSMCDAIPFFPATSEKFVPLNDHSLKNARSAWEGDRGESTDKWVRQLFAADFASLTELPVRESEKASGWASGSRVERWAQRIWGTYSETVSEAARVSADDVDATDSDGGDE
jgi:exodeoxyribonuclease V gamma subunit